MKRIKWMLVFIVIVSVLLNGCIVRNAELKEWDSNGQLVRQCRTGQANSLCWFALNSGEIYYEPGKVYWITANGLSERPDPNSIKAASGLVGAAAAAAAGL